MHYNRAMSSVAPATAPLCLSISVVLYRSAEPTLLRFRDSLCSSVRQLREQRSMARVTLAVVDNAASEDGDRFSRLFTALPGIDAVRFIQAECNLGYGRAHNRCLQQGSDFHLILNPDVYLAPDALVAGLDYLQQHSQVGLVAPWGENDGGEPLYLCKRYPTVLDFLLRGFAPVALRKLFDARLSRYEMRAQLATGEPCDSVEIASGCCMLLRAELLQRLGGFDEEYFLYFEDFDLSMRLRQFATIACVPAMRVIHDGGQAARKGWWHVRQFAAAGWRFFHRHGWRWW